MSGDSIIAINGNAHDHGSVRIKIMGKPYFGIKSVKYDQKRTRGKVMKLGPAHAAIGFTQGTYECGDCTLTMLRRTAQDLRDHAAERAGTSSYGDAIFPIIVQYITPGVGPCKDELLRCSIMSDAGGTEQGSPDPLYEDVVFQVIKMKRNGKTLYTARKG